MIITIDQTWEQIVAGIVIYFFIFILVEKLYKTMHLKSATKMAKFWPFSLPFMTTAWLFGTCVGLFVGFKKMAKEVKDQAVDKPRRVK